MLKLPIVLTANCYDDFVLNVDADRSPVTRLTTVHTNATREELWAIVTAVNEAPAQERRIAELEKANRSLVAVAETFLEGTHFEHGMNTRRDRMECTHDDCKGILSAIRAAGGD